MRILNCRNNYHYLKKDARKEKIDAEEAFDDCQSLFLIKLFEIERDGWVLNLIKVVSSRDTYGLGVTP